MKALTLHGAYAWCVIFGGKDIENRSWVPPEKLVGQRIAIHAGQNQGDPEERRRLRHERPGLPGVLPRGVILGTVLLKGYVKGDISGGLTKAEVRRAERSEWAAGPSLWVLDDPRPFARPLPCKGQLGLWNVPS